MVGCYQRTHDTKLPEQSGNFSKPNPFCNPPYRSLAKYLLCRMG